MAAPALASATSEGSLPETEVAPTGGTGDNSPSFWDSVLKPRGSSNNSSENASAPPSKPTTTTSGNGMFGWLGLGLEGPLESLYN